MLDMGEIIFIPAYQQEDSLSFNKNKKVFEILHFEECVNETNLDWNAYHFKTKKVSDNDIWIMNTGEYIIQRLDKNLSVKNRICITDDICYVRGIMSTGNIISEREQVGLREFIKYVTEG